MAADIGRERFDGTVAAIRIGIECDRENAVEIAAKRAATGAARARRFHRRHAFAAGERLRIRQQFEEQHAERIDVARGCDGAAEELFGAGVVGSHETGDGCVGGNRIGRQLRDAEVEQLRNAVVGDEHVRRFDVAMNDEIAMRVLHGVAELEEEAQSRVERQRALAAIDVDRRALDVLHREERQAG